MELVNCFVCKFALSFHALLSMVSHIKAPRDNLCLTCHFKFDISTVGDKFVNEPLFFNHNSVVDLRFALSASEVYLVDEWRKFFQVDRFLQCSINCLACWPF